MRRRFTLAIVGVVALGLLIAGVGTLALLSIQSKRTAKSDVVTLAARIASEAAATGTDVRPGPSLARLQNFLKQTQDLSLLVVAADGTIAGTPPAHIPVADLDGVSLVEGHSVSGTEGSVAYAAAPFTVRARHLAAVVTEPYSTAGGAALYLLLGGAVALIIAFGVAETLSHRITHPLVAVEQAAGRIANGDLSARAPEPRQSYPELTSLTASINAMADNLEQLRGLERQFLMSVSHDLRTPLTSIRGFAEALADGTASDPAKAGGVILSEARRLERLVRDLLDLAKLDAHQFAMDVRSVDLWEVVSDTAEGFEPTAADLGLHLVIHEPDQPANVMADPDRLAQVIANLVENASKYATTRIDVAAWRDGATTAHVTVDDDGPGIPADELPRVFDRLWSDSRGVARQVGSGLGLAIVAELAHAMGGDIQAQSPIPGETAGTRMTVSLKRA